MALHAEAAPLIAALGWKQIRQTPFPVFGNENQALILSGIGSLQAACAVTYLQTIRPARFWLNIGIAGHPTLPIGRGAVASKISSPAGNTSFYPPKLFSFDLPHLPLMTVDKPSDHYLPNTLHDMEGYGFYAAALRYTSVECIRCYKIVSDNADAPPSLLSKKQVPEIVGAHISRIEEFCTLLGSLDIPDFSACPEEEVFAHFRLSETLKKRLLPRLRFLYARYPEENLLDFCRKAKNTEELFQRVDEKIHDDH